MNGKTAVNHPREDTVSSSRHQGFGYLESLTHTQENHHGIFPAEPDNHALLRMQNLGSLASLLSHQLNNLLNTIMGYSTLALTEAGLPPELAKHIEIIVQTARQAAEVNGRFFSLAKPREKEEQVPVDIGRKLQEALSLLGRFPSRKSSLSYHIDPDLPPVLANPDALEQVILALLLAARGGEADNRLAFFTADRIDANSESAGRVRISVSQTHMPSTSRERLIQFEDEELMTSLPLVESIVRALGGTTATSSNANGTVEVEISLPIASEHKPEPPAKKSEGYCKKTG